MVRNLVGQYLQPHARNSRLGSHKKFADTTQHYTKHEGMWVGSETIINADFSSWNSELPDHWTQSATYLSISQKDKAFHLMPGGSYIHLVPKSHHLTSGYLYRISMQIINADGVAKTYLGDESTLSGSGPDKVPGDSISSHSKLIDKKASTPIDNVRFQLIPITKGIV